MVDIVTLGETYLPGQGKAIHYITGLMPFLDELDVDGDPAVSGNL